MGVVDGDGMTLVVVMMMVVVAVVVVEGCVPGTLRGNILEEEEVVVRRDGTTRDG